MTNSFHTPILIIGSGPAGYTAGIYAARAGLSPVIIEGLTPGGQLTTTPELENFPGFPEKITGMELMDRMRLHAENVGVKIVSDVVSACDLSRHPFVSTLDSGDVWTSDTLVIATGAAPRWLMISGEEEFKGFGISACATCDGFFYRNKKVAVIGGGNAAVEEALYLSKLVSSVTLIHRRDALRAEKVLQDRLLSDPKITVLWDTIPTAFVGESNPKGLTGIALKNVKTNVESRLDVDGVFVAIGHVPNTTLFKDQLELDDNGFIKTKLGTVETNVKGVFAAGDVQELHHRQAITAAAGGCRAALACEKALQA